MQIMAALLFVILAVFLCISDATKCHITNKRNYHGCWEWVLDDPNNSNCDIVVTGGLSPGVICCSNNNHKGLTRHVYGHLPENNSDKNHLQTSSETSPATRPSENEFSSSKGGTTDSDNVTTKSGTTATSIHSNDEASESDTTDGDSVTLAPPTPAYSEVCGRSYVSRRTDLVYWFRYIEIPTPLFNPRLTVKFEVKASQDAHIALAPSKQSTNELYQVVIGGSGNSATFIKRAMFASRLVSKNMNKPLNETVFRGFWITYNATSGHIAVGKYNKENHFIEWTDPTPLNISYVGFSTNGNSEGEWRFCDF